MEKSARSKFLDLPRELRDLIYHFMLLPDSLDAWSILSLSNEDAYAKSQRTKIGSSSFLGPPLKRPAFHGLIQACTQTRSEILELLSTDDEATTYVCNITQDGHRVFVSWPQLPCSWRQLRRVNVQIWTAYERGANWGGSGGPPQFIQLLVRMLLYFLQHGHGFTHRDGHKQNPNMPGLESLTIEVLELCRPEGSSRCRVCFSSKAKCRHSAVESLTALPSHDKREFNIIKSHLSHLHALGTLYGRVRELTIMQKGEGSYSWRSDEELTRVEESKDMKTRKEAMDWFSCEECAW